MSTYAAILGHQPHISLAELRATFPDFKLIKHVGPDVAVFESAREISADDHGRLGGIIAMAQGIEEHASIENVPRMLLKQAEKVRGKVTFGLRAYGVPRETVKRLYRDCKDALRKIGRPARYVGNEAKPAASALLHDAGMVDGSHGCELMLIDLTEKTAERATKLPHFAQPSRQLRPASKAARGEPSYQATSVWIGRTVAAQDVDAYTKRDMEKPVRDTRVGLLPPKLAQMLLNFGAWLASTNQKSEINNRQIIVYDPFCGTGVIPMECLLRGWPVLGSDTSPKAVNGASKNLEWVRKEFEILKRDVPSALWRQDATKSFDFSHAKSAGIKELPNVIVTETMLGTPFEKRPPIREAMKQKTEIEKLQADFLRNASASLPGVPIVAIWPVWFPSSGVIALENIWDVLHECGYQATLPPGSDPEMPGRLSLLYRRKGQFVGREIVMLRARKN